MNEKSFQHRIFLGLLAIVTLAFIWILLPFYGAVFWAVILGVLFAPLQRRLLLKLRWQRNLAALCTLAICLLIAILPVIVICLLLIQEGAMLYKNIESGQLDISSYVIQFKTLLPPYFRHLLDHLGMGDLNGLRDKIAKAAMQGSQYLATQAFTVGQGTFDFMVSFFIMLYLLFYLLRDGTDMVRRVRTAIPLAEHQKRLLQLKFNRVVRATVKGNLVMAVVQGILGGLIFWCLDISSALLWAVVMAFASLLPAIGAAIVWAPVAVYFLINGMIWQGVVLGLFGIFVIGLVDTVLRPILVGKDTRMPDYLILISTLGGIAVFGLNGFVIGPLVAALFMSTWEIFVENKQTVRLPG
ncbi:AI-2E family transporter [Pseudomonas sp. NA-150]|uniref:AI-2E family transporter n=1 Tax=Pseudomonas sp. NA-150 TaxID=3367525 RepID=UPI0037CB9E9D